jgi:hypothetical protein
MAERNRHKKPIEVMSREDREYLQRELSSLKPKNERLRRMIEAASQNVDEGVTPMTSKEIYEYLGRK